MSSVISLDNINSDKYPIMADKRSKQNVNSAFFKGEFSFVNKDAKSIDSKEHNVIVSRHVTNKYGQWKRQLSVSSLDQSADSPSSAMPTEMMCQSGQKFGAQSMDDELYLAYTPPFNSAAPPIPTEYDQRVPNQLLGGEPFRPKLSSINSAQLMHPTVAENRFPTTMDAHNRMSDAQGHEAFASSNHSTRERPMNGTSSSLSLEPVISQPWPTEVANMQNHYEAIGDWNNETTVNPIQNRCNTSSETHSAPDTKMLEAHLKQFLLEMRADNLAAARQHLKALKNLVTAQGGIIHLKSSFRANLLSCDCYFALKYGTRPVFPAQEWTPGPLSQHWKARLISAGINVRGGDQQRSASITSIMNSTIPHPKLRSILADFRELFETHEYILNHGLPADNQLLWWANFRKFDCISRLADHCVDLAIYPHLHEKPRTQSVVAIAVSLLANMVLGSPEPAQLGLKLLQELRAALTEGPFELESGESNTEDDSGNENEKGDKKKRLRLQFWILYVGTLAENAHPVDDIHKLWFQNRLNKLAKTLGVYGRWSEMRRLLQPFLFSESLHHWFTASESV